MKKLGILTLMLLSTASLIAQKEVYINPKVGINFSGIQDEPEGVSTNNQVGYNAGLDIRLGSGLVFFQPGVFYYQYNQEYTVVLTGQNQVATTQDIKVQSIKVPVQLGIQPIATDFFTFRINAGAGFNFPVNVQRQDENFAISRQNYKDVNVGGIVGAGIDLSIITLDLNYEFGLSDYVDFSQSQNLNSGSSKQYVVSLNLGVKF